jgi:hypothetical protein
VVVPPADKSERLNLSHLAQVGLLDYAFALLFVVFSVPNCIKKVFKFLSVKLSFCPNTTA